MRRREIGGPAKEVQIVLHAQRGVDSESYFMREALQDDKRDAGGLEGSRDPGVFFAKPLPPGEIPRPPRRDLLLNRTGEAGHSEQVQRKLRAIGKRQQLVPLRGREVGGGLAAQHMESRADGGRQNGGRNHMAASTSDSIAAAASSTCSYCSSRGGESSSSLRRCAARAVSRGNRYLRKYAMAALFENSPQRGGPGLRFKNTHGPRQAHRAERNPCAAAWISMACFPLGAMAVSKRERLANSARAGSRRRMMFEPPTPIRSGPGATCTASSDTSVQPRE